ncbi:hypothetical protein PHO31112_05323 [Pandoraea horticolens]|uniref:Uncharacterized protein n=1 Tax=Pandoraea horticolens TaxID=2508298 RepID=A0A5E4ZBL9_9BURK|nr:sialidase family protein [Pandoraea horticolens]VVE58464.1 hypothetical protein PHO31112_05323 [Pandoraea horticolens]
MSIQNPTATLAHGEADTIPQQISGTQTTNSPAFSAYKHKLWLAYLQDSKYKTASFDGAAWTVASDPIKSNSQSGPPTLVTFNGKLYLVHIASSSQDLYCMTYDGTSWSADTWMFTATGMPAETTVAVALFKKQLYVAWRNESDNKIGINTWNGQGAWPNSNLSFIPGIATLKSPALATFNKKLFVVHVANDSSNYIHYSRSTDGTTWKTPEGVIQDKATKAYAATGQAPAAVTFDGKLWVAYVNASNQLSFATFDGTAWSLAGSITEITITGSPTLEVYNVNGKPKLFCGVRGSDNAIWWFSVAAGAAKNVTGYVSSYTFGSANDPAEVSFELMKANGTKVKGSMDPVSDTASTGFTVTFVTALTNGYEVVVLDSHIDFDEYSGVKVVPPLV